MLEKTENFKNILSSNLRTILFSLVFSLLFLSFVIIGDKISLREVFYLKIQPLSYFILFIIMETGCFLIFKYLDKIEELIAKIRILPFFEDLFLENNKKCFWACFIFLTICHLPAFIAYFPGLYTYDTWWQLHFFVNHDYVEMHPVFHNLLVYWAFLIQKISNSTWLGVFLYTLLQWITMTGIFSYCVNMLSKFKVAYVIRLIALLFFALYPTNQVFPLIATKDTLFTGFVLLMVIEITDLIKNKEEFLSNRFKKIFLVLIIIFILILRMNGIIAYIILLPFLLYFLKNEIKRIWHLFLIPLIFFLGFTWFKGVVGIYPPTLAASLGIPLQQMARVRVKNDAVLSLEDKMTYERIITPGKEKVYYPFSADSLKFDGPFLNSNFIDFSLKSNPSRFINLYTKWMTEYPKDYIDAFLLNNYKYWYIKAPYREYKKYPHYYLQTKNLWHNFYGVRLKEENFLPKVKEFYNNIFLKNAFYSNPITLALFSFSYNTWFLILCFWILFYKKRYDCIIALAILPAIYITVLFGSTALIRYIYQNFLIIPVILAFCFGKFANSTCK
ncbi:hypothetical protein IJS77_04745 [bacterium]|nr:hypothetical protein [bacterium]